MVSLALGLIVCLVLLTIQLKFSAQSARSVQISARDHEARVAMDVITRDLGGSGFLLGGLNCPAVLSYNATAPAPGYFAALPVSSIAAQSGQPLPFVSGGSIVLNYPSAPSGVVSDVLVVGAAAGSAKMSAATVSTVPNAAFQPATDGRLPVARIGTLAAGDTAIVQVILDSATGQWLCLRVPVTATGSAAGSPYIQSSGSYMPPDFYAGFGARVALAGMNGAIGNAQLQQARVTDLDPAALSNQRTYAYYIDASDAWPVLMRATVNAASDTPIGAPQAIAAGVVSLQVQFGVDTAGAGSVNQYLTGSNLVATRNVRNVRSIRVALVTRSLYSDSDFQNAGTTLAVPGGFSAYPIPAAYAKHRFTVQTTEIALRSVLWQ